AGNHHRSEWFGCACCPPNVARLMASLGEYLYAENEDSLFVNQFVAGSVTTKIGGKEVKVKVDTRYPWDGTVRFTMDMSEPVEFGFYVRQPGWATQVTHSWPSSAKVQSDKGYEFARRVWKKGDSVVYHFGMESQLILANPNVKADEGMVAIKRGPIVYCLEGIDQKAELKDIYLPPETKLKPQFEKDLLGGVMVLQGDAQFSKMQVNWTQTLYQPLPAETQKNADGEKVTTRGKTPIKAIPYYAWDNREACPMQVWIPMAPKMEAYATEGLEGSAKVELSHTSYNCYIVGINDGKTPKKSNQHPGELTHFWPRKGGEEWVSYSWDKPIETDEVRVYWFDDTGVGEIRPPVSWSLEYQKDNGEWAPVEASKPYSVELDKWIDVSFKPVKTKALRLKVQQQEKFAVGIHEWQVFPLE
ncbi:MAG: glycoside hydrolase family 127 protein, partial [Verrucomicrobia bacterium]|nr:glycoside hydrolase family 127 protein [Verrucomicrobiota bacterium]